jgi:putative transposase
MPFGAEPLVLTEEERQELQQMTQSRTLPAGDVMRSRMVLLLADGVAYQKIQDLLDTTAPTIARWKRRFLKHRIAGLMEELHPGQARYVRTPKLQAKVLAAIQEGPKDGSTHWSCRKLASRFQVSKDTSNGFCPKPTCARIDWNATWPATIRISRPRLPT